VDVFGERISGPYAGIGVVSQAATLFPWRSVVENVLLPAHILGVPDSIGRPQALKLIAQVGLKGQEHRYPHELSGGMAQRVAVARALMNNPRILLLDEPFGSLDGLTRGVLNLELTRAWEATRATALLVTHSIEEAVFLSDKIAVLSGRPGHIIGLVDVPLPRPRTLQDRRTASFVEVSSRIDDLLAAQLP
jgi:NitT/TauT family transport system ATP-binding protein